MEDLDKIAQEAEILELRNEVKLLRQQGKGFSKRQVSDDVELDCLLEELG